MPLTINGILTGLRYLEELANHVLPHAGAICDGFQLVDDKAIIEATMSIHFWMRVLN